MTIKCLVSTVGLLVLTMTGAPFAEERISLADTGATQLGSDAPAAPSCQGKCGQNLGSCWCDTACKSYGDCCPDYDQWCGLKTCQGKCGGAGIGGCWCDTACKSYGDCCPDYDEQCVFGTCKDHCGGLGIGSCWCDSLCPQYGDCCWDYDEQCALETCKDHCGGKSGGNCWCDAACKSYGDCCPDYDHECPPSPECGNEVIDPGEDCDPPGPFCRGGCNVQLGICVDYSCRADCSCPDPVCGDYIIDAGEECDDGNTAPGDGCSSDCLLE